MKFSGSEQSEVYRWMVKRLMVGAACFEEDENLGCLQLRKSAINLV